MKKMKQALTITVLTGLLSAAPLGAFAQGPPDHAGGQGGGPPSVESGDNDVTDEPANRGQAMRAEREAARQAMQEARQESREAFHAVRIEQKTLFHEQRRSLEEAGDIDGAYEVQTELVKTDLMDRSEYTALGHLYDRRSQAPGQLKVFVNGDHPVFDTPPVVREGRTLLPLRAVSQALKADEVDWDASESKVTITRGDLVMELVIGEAIAYLNGQPLEMDTTAAVENSRTIVPIRFISEAFGVHVDYDDDSKSAIIVDEEANEEEAVDEDDEEDEAQDGDMSEEETDADGSEEDHEEETEDE